MHLLIFILQQYVRTEGEGRKNSILAKRRHRIRQQCEWSNSGRNSVSRGACNAVRTSSRVSQAALAHEIHRRRFCSYRSQSRERERSRDKNRERTQWDETQEAPSRWRAKG